MAVQDLIAETLAQHITQPKILSYAPTKLNEVQGRFVASNRVYNFILNKDGISYSPAGQGDSLLFSALFLRQDAARKPKVGNDKCNAGKSYQCGKICLGNRRKCHKGVRDVNDARRIASILESTNEQLKSKVGSEVSAKAKARGEALFGARGKREKDGKPERVKDVVFSLDDIDLKKGTESYSHLYRNPEGIAKMAQKVYFGFMNTIKDDALKHLPKGNETILNQELDRVKKEYISRQNSVFNAASGTTSSFVAGGSNFNKNQADRRGSSYDRALKDFDSWKTQTVKDLERNTGIDKVKQGLLDSKKTQSANEVAKFQNQATNYLKATLKIGDKVQGSFGETITVKRINPKSITEETGVQYKYDEIMPMENGKAISPKEFIRRVREHAENPIAEVKPVIKSIADIPDIPESAKPWVKSVEKLATPELVAIANKVGFPVVTISSKTGAYYISSENIVHMATHKSSSPFSVSTFLHEYGHCIDYNLGERTIRKPISSTEAGIQARKLDEKIIKSAQTQSIYKSISPFVDKSIIKGIKESKDLLEAKLKPDYQASSDIYETSKKVLAKSIELGLGMTFSDRQAFRQAVFDLERLSDGLNTDDPMTLARNTKDSIRGYVIDLLGSITKNKVGHGHSDNYYRKNKNAQGTEAFANIIAIANSGDEKAIAVAKKFAPNMWKFVMDSIKV
jgi:hypothetical protein